ncbi:MAG: hypothetical protein ACK476_02020, partial [Fluviicola sp.]
MKLVLVISFLVYSKLIIGQFAIDPISLWNLKKLNGENYSIIQPQIIYEDPFVKLMKYNIDTLIEEKDTTISFKQLITPARLYEVRNLVSLVTENFVQYDSTLTFRSSLGFNVQGSWKKWMNKTQVLSGWSAREADNQVHSFILPLNNNSYYWYNDVRTRFGYNANKQLHISFGIDNQFFGEGYRSLIQSDQVAPNPFAMLRTKFWRFEYGLLYQFYHEQQINSRYLKFNALHYLSYNVTDKFNISLFEQVLFPSKDGQLKRNFEVEYLNPIVFFRPQEYSIGSADNVLLALNTSYDFKNSTLYGQIALDEFVLSEIRARSKWWANKYAV